MAHRHTSAFDTMAQCHLGTVSKFGTLSPWHRVILAHCTLAVPVVGEGAGAVVGAPGRAPVCLSQELAAVEGREGGGGLGLLAGTLGVVPHVLLQLGPQQVPLLGGRCQVGQGEVGSLAIAKRFQ